MAKIYSDIKLRDGFADKYIIITVKQFDDIIASNEPDDIIGVEEDLQAIVDTQRHSTLPFYIYVSSLNPLNIIAGNNYEQLKNHG